MKVGKIKKLKNNKYKITIDDFDIVVYDDILIKYNILYKKEIDTNLLKTISEENLYYNNYNKALKYSLKKIRSKKEVYEYLEKLEMKKYDIDKIISKLEDLNILNDINFVRAYINDKIILSKDSLNKIKDDLIKSGIKSSLIEEEIQKNENNDKEKLEKLILKRINSNHRFSTYNLKNKVLNEFLNLGYEYDDIVEIYDNNKRDDYDILLKEYNKLKYKYKDKYSNYETIISSKLFSKGFKYSDIKPEDL